MSDPKANDGFFPLQASDSKLEEAKEPLFAFPDKITSMSGREEILYRIANYTRLYFSAEIATIGIIQENRIVEHQISVVGENQTHKVREFPLSEIDNELSRQAYATMKIVSEDNYPENTTGEVSEYIGTLKDNMPLAKMVIPIDTNEVIIALLTIGKRDPYKWTPKDYLYAEQIRALATIAIYNAQQFQSLTTLNLELEDRNRVLETLMEFNRRLRGPIELTPTAERGLMLTMEIVNAEVGVLHLLNEANPKQLRLFLSRTTTEPVSQTEFPQWTKVIKLGYGPVGRAMKDKRSLVIDELSSISKVEADRQLNSGMFVPLLVGDNLIGSISLLSRHRNHFTEQQVLFTETIAGQIATAIQQVSRIELRREQERLSAVLALARTAAHDLNQPLQVLQAELEFITKMGETPSPDTYHNMLLAIKDMTSKIREYQKIVRVETTEQVPGIRVIDRSRSLPTVPDKN